MRKNSERGALRATSDLALKMSRLKRPEHWREQSANRGVIRESAEVVACPFGADPNWRDQGSGEMPIRGSAPRLIQQGGQQSSRVNGGTKPEQRLLLASAPAFREVFRCRSDRPATEPLRVVTLWSPLLCTKCNDING